MKKCMVCGNESEGTYSGVPICVECYQGKGLADYLENTTFAGAQNEDGDYFVSLIENSGFPVKYEDIGKRVDVDLAVVWFIDRPITIALVYNDYIYFMADMLKVNEWVPEPPEVADPDVKWDAVSERPK